MSVDICIHADTIITIKVSYFNDSFICGCVGFSSLQGLFSNSGEWGILSSWGTCVSHCSPLACCRAPNLGAWAQ